MAICLHRRQQSTPITLMVGNSILKFDSYGTDRYAHTTIHLFYCTSRLKLHQLVFAVKGYLTAALSCL